VMNQILEATDCEYESLTRRMNEGRVL